MALTVPVRDSRNPVNKVFPISPRFLKDVKERIECIERDAAYDEAQLERLDDSDHIRRQMRLVAAERTEALRMRVFLDRARVHRMRPSPLASAAGNRVVGECS